MTTQTLSLPLVLPSGAECDRCAARLQADLARVKGVSGVAVDRAHATVAVSFDPNLVTVSRIESEAARVGAEIAQRIEHQTVELRDLDCPDCAATIEKAVNQLPGVLWAGANFAAAQLYAEYERGRVGLKDIARIAASHGVRACPLTSGAQGDDACDSARTHSPFRAFWEEHRKVVSVAATAVMTAAGFALHRLGFPAASAAAYSAGILIGGWSTGRAGAMALRTRAVDMNVLMSVAVIGAAAIGDWFEAATVVLLYDFGALLQAYTVERTRRSIRSLMDLAPRVARVVRGGRETSVPVEQVQVDDIVLVRPGERFPADGEVVTGSTTANQAPITGEAMPVEKNLGDPVFAGTLNGSGAVEVLATHLYSDTTLARIIHRVEEAQAQRAPVQQYIDRFARVYTPAVVGLAVLIAIAPPITLGFLHIGVAHAAVWSLWFRRALSLLIIACPCALVISTPVAIVTAIGSASKRGALIKGGAFLEQLGRLRAMLYDKTGTLTYGRFGVHEVVTLDGITREQILLVAAAVESRSEHPLASAFIEAAGPGPLPRVDSFQALSGRGARAELGGKTYYVGNSRLLADQGIARDGAAEHVVRLESLGRTAVLVAAEDGPIGVIGVSDTARPGVAAVVRELAQMGITRQVMLTGDNPGVARSVAAECGLSEFRAGLLPEQKLESVHEIQREAGPLGMVGDGVNDAPALAGADVGIVMGAAGSDTAIETADVALMADDLTRLPFLIRLSRRTNGVIRQNIAFSLATKGVLLVSAVVVGLPLWLAVMGDVGVSLLVTLNALRLRHDVGGASPDWNTDPRMAA